VLDELPSRKTVPSLDPSGCQRLHELRRMHGPAPPRLRDSAGAFVERLQRTAGRVVDLDGDASPSGAEEADQAFMSRSTALANSAPNRDHLDPEPIGRSRVTGDEAAHVGRADLDHRPAEERHAIPEQALRRRAMGLKRPHRLQDLGVHPLDLGKRRDLASLVSERGQIAHLRKGEESLVGWVRACPAPEEVDVLG
jgi:hypothetical protein